MSLDISAQVKRRLRKEVVRRWALMDCDRLVFCYPSGAEKWGAKPRVVSEAGDGKVVYLKRRHAEGAAAEFERLGHGKQYAYECKRGAHWHLTRWPPRDVPPSGAAKPGGEQ